MTTLVANIQSDVPLPATATDAFPPLTDMQEIEMRGRTVKLIADIQGVPIEPSEDHRAEAAALAQQVLSDSSTKINLNNYPNETMAYLAGMVSAYQADLVLELADLKRFVINKLVKETDHPDAKVRVAALTKLGEVDGVDAFKKRSEVTHKHQTIEEVEKELLETLDRMQKRTIDVEVVEVKSANNS